MDLCALGHVAHTRDLRDAGWTRARLARALDSGSLRRLQRGTFACTHISAPRIAAATMGATLSCISVLREHRVWAGHDQRVHVQLSPRSSADVPPGVRAHRAAPRYDGGRWEASRTQALHQAIRCLDGENAVAALESAIARGFLPEDAVRRLGALAPQRLQHRIRRLVITSGSGNETIVRLRLQEYGFQVEAQGHIPGLGHQDLVVEGCLGLEIDSEAFLIQGEPVRDRERLVWTVDLRPA